MPLVVGQPRHQFNKAHEASIIACPCRKCLTPIGHRRDAEAGLSRSPAAQPAQALSSCRLPGLFVDGAKPSKCADAEPRVMPSSASAPQSTIPRRQPRREDAAHEVASLCAPRHRRQRYQRPEAGLTARNGKHQRGRSPLSRASRENEPQRR